MPKQITRSLYYWTHLPSQMGYVGQTQSDPDKHFRAYWLDAQRQGEHSNRKLYDYMHESQESDWQKHVLWRTTAPEGQDWSFSKINDLESQSILAFRTYDPYGLNLTMGGVASRGCDTIGENGYNPLYQEFRGCLVADTMRELGARHEVRYLLNGLKRTRRLYLDGLRMELDKITAIAQSASDLANLSKWERASMQKLAQEIDKTEASLANIDTPEEWLRNFRERKVDAR